MPHSKHQMIFSFLANDPVYLRDLREERIIEEARASLEPVLCKQMVDILQGLAQTEFNKDLKILVADTVENVMKGIRCELIDMRRSLERLLHRSADRNDRCDDPADWWKHGGEPDEDEEHPF